MGLNNVGDIFRFDGEKFVQVPGKLITMAVNGSFVWGINENHDVFKKAFSSDSFDQVPGKLTKIAIDEEEAVFGLN